MAGISSHIEVFDPTFGKVLVRHNPTAIVHRISGKRTFEATFRFPRCPRPSCFMFELSPRQNAAREAGRRGTYDLELRPRLMVEAIEELQHSGVDPDLWKVEGLVRREDCERVVAAARAGGRHNVGCIVLGGSRQLCRGSSDLQSAARFFGIRWSPGGR
jgi:hypothetical protein